MLYLHQFIYVQLWVKKYQHVFHWNEDFLTKRMTKIEQQGKMTRHSK